MKGVGQLSLSSTQPTEQSGTIDPYVPVVQPSIPGFLPSSLPVPAPGSPFVPIPNPSTAAPSTLPSNANVQLPIGFAPGFNPNPSPGQAPQAPIQLSPTGQSQGIPTWLLVVGGLVVVAVVGLGIWYFIQDEKTVPIGSNPLPPRGFRGVRKRSRRRGRRRR